MRYEHLKPIPTRWQQVKSVERGVDADGDPVVVICLTEDGMTTTERLTFNRVELMDLYHAIGACVPEWT